MSIAPKTTGVHHINLRCTDLEKSKAFYQHVIGFTIAFDMPELFAFAVGADYIVFKKAADGATFNPFTIGMDHLAMACESLEELNRVAAALTEANVENTGVKTDPTLQKQYVAFKDIDRIQWEFYMN